MSMRVFVTLPGNTKQEGKTTVLKDPGNWDGGGNVLAQEGGLGGGGGLGLTC